MPQKWTWDDEDHKNFDSDDFLRELAHWNEEEDKEREKKEFRRDSILAWSFLIAMGILYWLYGPY